MNSRNLLLSLRQNVSSYSPTLQKLGSFILQHPEKVLYMTITELARESQTSEASVTRLCRHLNCKGYSEFRMALAISIHPETKVKAAEQGLVATLVEDSIRALRDTESLLDNNALLAAAGLLSKTELVHIYGVAASAVIGDYLHYKLLRLGKSALIYSDMHRAAMDAVALNQRSVVIIISSSGSTKDVLHAATLARQAQAQIIAISNSQHSPLARLADILLVAAKPEGPLTAGTLPTKVGALLILEALICHIITSSARYPELIQSTASATLPLLL